ncbi:AraC family transcriptional regulator [Dyadobacter sp. CY261]|uniref:AraC family transcriptional regulator n=1 Tax=Dyadobacter sp. CY261 TaxID=2907203 RepID=UPI001F320082|nr:AraC family transcriptional regulator [Dyadobacter sp. CY261]MCF0072894.1 AraC family transcriptional regulator [Dyadobacter sp. CY261]
MEKIDGFLDRFKQNRTLPVRVVSPGFGHVPPEEAKKFGTTVRTSYYFFLFMMDGSSRHGVDLQDFEVNSNELLFVLPHQVHRFPVTKKGSDYFKIGFEESCLSLLPRQYPFLINPSNNPKIRFSPAAAVRVKSIFENLLELLSSWETEADLILAHLNSLLTEINAAYFAAGKSPVDHRLSKFIDFKLFVENNLTEHPKVEAIAAQLLLSPNTLYGIVKYYSGFSPKEFIINRLILEARRRLYYSENFSVKELAFDLGFNDPEYFSRLFKKVTGKTIAAFFQDLSGT